MEARSFLLEELFNKFSGPLDLASSIQVGVVLFVAHQCCCQGCFQVVNNVRKMPYLTPTQLRTCILQHRDMYLDRQILEITVGARLFVIAVQIAYLGEQLEDQDY